MNIVFRNVAILASVGKMEELLRFSAGYVLRIFGNKVSGTRLYPRQIEDESVRFKAGKNMLLK